MRCPKCGKIIKSNPAIFSNLYICTVCGASFSEDGREDNVAASLKSITVQYGAEVLSDVRKVNALLMDYMPRRDRERKLIISVMNEGVCPRLLKVKDRDAGEQQLQVNRCIHELVRDLWITEEAAGYAVNILAQVLGLTAVVPAPEERGAEAGAGSGEQTLSKQDVFESGKGVEELLSGCSTVGYKAFAAHKGLTSVSLPSSVRTISSKAFAGCSNLKHIVLPASLENMGTSVFDGCYDLEQISVEENPSYKVISGMLIHKKKKELIRAENRERMSSVTVPEGIERIKKRAFDWNRVPSVRLPKSLTEIEDSAFHMVWALEQIDVDSKNPVFSSLDGVLFDRRRTKLILYPQGRKEERYIVEDTVSVIGKGAFGHGLHLQTVTIPDSVTRLEERAFEYGYKLESIMLPGSVAAIGDRAFQYCSKLKTVMLSRSIEEIGDYAFYGCRELGTISIPRLVERIGNMAFGECEKLTRIVIQDKVRFIGDGAFVGCPGAEVAIRNNPYVETYCRAHHIPYSVL